MKQNILNNVKNIYGWKTNRKLVVISVDDYGNVRLDSKAARENMKKSGLNLDSRFDKYDTLETREDLEALYDVLSSVKDKNDHPAVFTPFALSSNIDFEAMASDNFQEYIYELLPQTFQKLSNRQPLAYSGAWELWKEGIDKGLMKPQYHGREHFNLRLFKGKLKKRDRHLLISLKNNSNIGLKSVGFENIKYTAAFGYSSLDEIAALKDIAIDGVKNFQQVYGYNPCHFMAPTANVHGDVVSALKPHGIVAYDRGIVFKEYQGKGKYKTKYNYTGKRNKDGQIILVRNVVFEPTSDSSIHVDQALAQVAAAFYWNKPANISSHRVNYCGHIEEKNRMIGLSQLNILLKKIVKRWPDVEFISSSDLIKIMRNE